MNKIKIKEILINTGQMIGAPSVGLKNHPTMVLVRTKKFPYIKPIQGKDYYNQMKKR